MATALRRYKESRFEKQHGVNSIMSFRRKACSASKAVNKFSGRDAAVEGSDIV